jgi:putative endonuclease
VFVEVKTRTSSDFGQPEAFVNERKSDKIREGAEHYIISNDWTGNIRFDIISIKTGKENELIHFEDAIH